MIPFKQELQIAREAAFDAGRLILSHYDTRYAVEHKEDDSPVTIADREASELIIQRLQKAFPADLIVSEEHIPAADLTVHERVWIIDPVDGTQEFINHNGEFAVLIGLVQAGQPVAGVVYQPVTDQLCWASQGQGAFIQRATRAEQLWVSAHDRFIHLRIAASRSHMTPELWDLYRQLEFGGVIRSGSMGLKLAMIARQECDLYLNLSGQTSCWDTCASQILLTEAGGKITNLSGQPLDYGLHQLKNTNGVLASNGALHEQLLEKIHHLLETHAFLRQQEE
jgi:3'(2'), 5'-bisphosphate nucleotidase